MATLRLFVNDGSCASGIYEENVVGGYKNRAGEVVLLVKNADKAQFQLHRLEPKQGICRDIGAMPSEIQNDFEETAAGTTFYLRSVALQKMEKSEVLASVFRLPVWYHAARDETVDQSKLVPLNARMHHKSRFQVLIAERARSESGDDRVDQALEFVGTTLKEN